MTKGEDILFGKKFEMTVETPNWVIHESGREYPKELVIKVKEGSKRVQLDLSQPILIEAESLIESLPWLTRFMVTLFSKHHYFRFRSRVVLKLDIEGKHIEKQGTAIFEMMLLRGKHTVK